MAKRKGYSPIGIDLQHHTAKMVQFHHGPAGTRLAACASVAFSETIGKLEDHAPQSLVSDLREAVKRGGFRGNSAVLALPPVKVDVRTLTLPGSDGDLDKMLKWEAESYLHYDVANARIDHVKLGDVAVGNEKRSEVLVAAADATYLRELLDLFGKARIHVFAIDIVPMALCRVCSFVGPDAAAQPTGIIDIGRTSSIAAIANRGDLRLTRVISRGGDELTMRIKDNLEITQEEAEILKKEYGIGTPGSVSFGEQQELVTKTEIAGTVHEILRHDLDDLASEFQKLFRYFAAQCKGASVTRGYLCGGGGKLKGLDSFLSERTGVRIEALPPIASLLPPLDGGPGECGIEFAVAAGLALRAPDQL